MPFHSDLGYAELHKAKFDSGLDASLPANPEGVGDIYWAPDGNGGNGALYIADAAGTAWMELSVSGAGINLNDLGDVDTTGVGTGDVLTYNGSSWVAGSATVALNDLSDVTISTPSSNQVLQYNGSIWVNATLSLTTSLNSLTDVDTTGVTTGKTIIYNGSTWEDGLPTMALSDLSDVDAFAGVAIGDLMVYRLGGTWDNFPVGTDGQIIVANSAQPSGISWNDPGYFNPDTLLTDSQSVLIDSDGNVLTT